MSLESSRKNGFPQGHAVTGSWAKTQMVSAWALLGLHLTVTSPTAELGLMTSWISFTSYSKAVSSLALGTPLLVKAVWRVPSCHPGSFSSDRLQSRPGWNTATKSALPGLCTMSKGKPMSVFCKRTSVWAFVLLQRKCQFEPRWGLSHKLLVWKSRCCSALPHPHTNHVCKTRNFPFPLGHVVTNTSPLQGRCISSSPTWSSLLFCLKLPF